MTRASLVLAFLTACGASPVRPTTTVAIAGDDADSLGRAIERDGALVRVELHEGPSLWVESSRVSALELAAGASVVARDASGELFSGVLSERHDRTLLVTRTDGRRVLVPLGDVLSVLRVPLAPTGGTVVTDTTPETTEPAPDPRRFALRAAGTSWLERVEVVSCAGGTARVLGPSGTPTSVPARDLSAPRAEVGDVVQAFWQSGETAYRAVVIGVNGAQMNVRYDDGSEEWLPLAMLAGREGTALGHPGCPRPGETHAMLRRGPLSRVVEVLSCTAGAATVRAAGAVAPMDVPLAELHPLIVPPGARAEVLWQESAPYLAWAGAPRDGGVEVTYDDGSVEVAQPSAFRWVAHEPPADVYVCPP